jgi:hypothetical protein
LRGRGVFKNNIDIREHISLNCRLSSIPDYTPAFF